MDVPRAGDNLNGFIACVHLQNPHVVRVRVALYLCNFAHHHVFYFRAKVGRHLLLGAGEGHRLGEFPVGGVHLHKFIQPFSGQ
ncbi:hypothetical protein SDC9_127212 [bioreactor metagenome]|uniref:Uncharacterized protein n=1 Tax=bioreactor metagenome TaxID=1076179 RepID=A0A645CTD9_9ZZZZ